MTFLETVQSAYNELRAAYYASASDGYVGVTHAGIAVVAADSGLVLMAQREFDPTDDPEVRETWEFPGGGLEPDEAPWEAAVREFNEEVGDGMSIALPEGRIVNGWRSADGVYQGFVYLIPTAIDFASWSSTDEVQNVGWYLPIDLMFGRLPLRPEFADFDWALLDVSRNREDDASMSQSTAESPTVEPPTIEVPEDEIEEPMLSYLDLLNGPIPVHGVLAPEDTESGDARGFNVGAITKRPLRLPVAWQEFSGAGHEGSVVVGSMDRLMRKDGLVHWEGLLMPSPEADRLIGLLAFFGRYGLSIDGDRGGLDQQKTQASGVLWFDAVRTAGATAVSVPAFAEAYIALGPHPDMPATGSDEEQALTASGTLAGARGPGWVTDPKATRRIHDYWTKPGQPGYAKIAWGKGGDFDRCVALVGEKIAANSPSKAGYIKQTCAQWHHDALGFWPSTHAKMDRAGTKAGLTEGEDVAAGWDDVLVSAGYDAEERKRLADDGKALSDGSFPIKTVEDLRNAIQSIGRAKDPAKAKALIRKRARELGHEDLIPDTWRVVSVEFTLTPMGEDDELSGQAYCCAGCGNLAQWSVTTDDPQVNGLYCNEHAPEYEDKPIPGFAAAEGIEVDADGSGWEAVLTSSAGTRAIPPASYFTRHPDTGALVIEEPDANGLRRTYGYAGQWGVCHIGVDGRCVELPEDDGEFNSFHLGRTKVLSGNSEIDYIDTGVITYKVDHRDARRILSETAEQQHYDNIGHAWAAVRLGVDDEGIWFSGVVLPGISEEDVVLIEATGQVSGEWKYGALRALQAVNVPGFPVPRSSVEYDDEGNVAAMVVPALAASALAKAKVGCYAPAEETPSATMRALAAADAEVRFTRLKKNWEG